MRKPQATCHSCSPADTYTRADTFVAELYEYIRSEVLPITTPLSLSLSLSLLLSRISIAIRDGICPLSFLSCRKSIREKFIWMLILRVTILLSRYSNLIKG